MKRIIYVLLVGLVFLTACGEASGSSSSDPEADAPLASVPAEYAGKTNPYDEEVASEGAKVFQTNCEMCHGPQGHGDGPAGQSLEPHPKNLAVLQKSVGDDYLFWRISEGKPGTSMVAWKSILDEEQIWKVVSFIRTLNE
jgi:mono/diheme cytochrome c family protein